MRSITLACLARVFVSSFFAIAFAEAGHASGDGGRNLSGTDPSLTAHDTGASDGVNVATPGQGCITFRSIVVEDVGGPDACPVISGGGSESAVLGGNDCAIEIELRISNWACVGPDAGVRTWQARFGDHALDFPPGITGTPELACSSDAECFALGYDEGCVDIDFPPDFDPDYCRRDWQVPTLPNDLLLDLPACSQSNYSCGATVFEVEDAPLDNGSEYFAATIRVLVEPGTTGNVVIPLLGIDIDTFVIMADGSQPPVGKVIDATITIPTGRCCDALGGCTDDLLLDECPGGADLWLADATCGLGSCLGACCDRNQGGCTEEVPPALCHGAGLDWREGFTCDQINPPCAPPAIPTVSEWGLLVLTLLFLVAGKVRFAAQPRAARLG